MSSAGARIPGTHSSAVERHELVYRVFAASPAQALSEDDVHDRVRRVMTRSRVHSAIHSLYQRGRIELVQRGNRSGTPTTYRLAAAREEAS